ncbi:MAG: alpha/beta fold hydrolase [Desulfatibacillaceae bacterium]
MPRMRYTALLMSVALCLSGCALFFPTKTPIATQWHTARDGRHAKTLLVMLPGRGDSPAGIVKNGFADAVRDSGRDVDMVLVDAHLGYYYKQNLIPRLHQDVLVPAREQGYDNIWICGISMGGLGSMLYAREHPETVSGVFLMAPFISYEEVEQEVADAGGIAGYSPPEPPDPADWERAVWLWFKGYPEGKPDMPVLVLGYAKEDKFHRANKMLADVLPDNASYELEGGHDWGPWLEMFRMFLADRVPE